MAPKAEKKGKKKTAHSSRNVELIRGLNARGRAAMSKKNRAFLTKVKGPQKGQEAKKVEAPVRKVEPRWYSADDTPRPVFSRKNKHKPTRLRKSITPGTVVIILAGRFRAKRAVFLKQLPSGLLLVTGKRAAGARRVRREALPNERRTTSQAPTRSTASRSDA
jgi:large subunit ribosomal protein L6e